MNKPNRTPGDNRLWFDKWGIKHRTNGPAYEHKSGYKAWFIRGEVIRDEDGFPLPQFYPRNSMRGLLGRSDPL
jgi:hypothetical protein